MMPPTTKTVSVDFTDASYIHGSNRVQGLAFTNFGTPTLVLDVSRAIQFEIFSPDASIAIPRIRKGGFAHLLQLRFIGNIRVLYRLADNDISFTKTVVIESAAILTIGMAYLAECQVFSLDGSGSNHIAATKQDQHEAKQSRGLCLRRNRRPKLRGDSRVQLRAIVAKSLHTSVSIERKFTTSTCVGDLITTRPTKEQARWHAVCSYTQGCLSPGYIYRRFPGIP